MTLKRNPNLFNIEEKVKYNNNNNAKNKFVPLCVQLSLLTLLLQQ